MLRALSRGHLANDELPVPDILLDLLEPGFAPLLLALRRGLHG
jgi:hypothetical protein